MSIFSIFMTAVGLAMDAFAVSVAKGMSEKDNHKILAFKLALAFGFFQGFMPFIGYWVGSYFQSFIVSIDHWIAFVLLSIIGIMMIKESFDEEENDEDNEKLDFKQIIILAIATSIDALAVGVSFAFLQVDILLAVILIGIVTFVLSYIAVFLGKKIGSILEKYAGIFGGIVLICIGLKILMEHLFFS